MELVLERALEAYDVVVVDGGASLDDRMLAIFSRSDTVVMPVLPEIPALNAVHLLLEQLTETGQVGATTVFVLNNAFARDLLKRADIEAALGAPISADLPYDSIAYLKAVNEGNPVVRSAPEVDGRGRHAQPREHRARTGRDGRHERRRRRAGQGEEGAVRPQALIGAARSVAALLVPRSRPRPALASRAPRPASRVTAPARFCHLALVRVFVPGRDRARRPGDRHDRSRISPIG